jgi:hypothetical protein
MDLRGEVPAINAFLRPSLTVFNGAENGKILMAG